MTSATSLACLLVLALNSLSQAYGEYATLTHDGPCIKGGKIIFTAQVFEDDQKTPAKGTFSYRWRDDGLYPHEFVSEATTNTTSVYIADFPTEKYPVGLYTMEVTVNKKRFFLWQEVTSQRISFQITPLLNGNLNIVQNNVTRVGKYVASGIQTKFQVNLRDGDNSYAQQNASDSTTYWFVDCQYHGPSKNFSFEYKFPKAGVEHTIEALVIVSHDPPATTTVAPSTTPIPTTTTTLAPNRTTSPTNGSSLVPRALETSTTPTNATTTITTTTTTIAPMAHTTSALAARTATNETVLQLGNLTFPFVCRNNSVVSPDAKKTYGFFHRDIVVKQPIGNITVEGTNWIQPWQTLALNITCPGSGPFKRCLRIVQGQYNVTGNETCVVPEEIPTCNFTIRHYFLESGVATVLVMLSNDVNSQVFPITITVYKAIKKPQLSVIVVPVSCSLVAVVLVIFGVAYYIQSRARFTVEVADFDFGQTNPEMEYKTFTERLRDSFNNSVRSAGYRINTMPRSYYGSMNDHRVPIADSKPIDQPLFSY